MEHDYTVVEQAVTAPMRTMPMIRKARRPRRPVFRVSTDYSEAAQVYDVNGMDSYMNRKNDWTNEYGPNDMSVDEILSEFHSGTLFSDFDYDSGSYDGYDEQPRGSEPDYAPEIDSRFNIGGRRSFEPVSYGGREVDLSGDEDYIPPTGKEPSPMQWTPGEDDGSYDDMPERPKKAKFGFGKKEKKKSGSSYQPRYIAEQDEEDEEEVFAQGFRDISDDGADYAGDGDYEDDIGDVDGEPGEGYFPPSFSEYLASIFASLFFRVRGTARGSNADTMQDEDEDLGPEVSPADAYKYYGRHAGSVKRRLPIAAGLLALMVYLSLGLPIPGMLGYLPVTAAACMAMQFTIMLLALDIVTNGILKMTRLQMGADSLAVLGCIVTSIDAALVAKSAVGALHMPLCAISSLSLVGIMYSSLLSARGLRKSLRVPAISKRVYSIVGENDAKSREITLLKTSRPATGFVHRCEEEAPDESIYARFAPFMLLGGLVLALIVSAVTHNYYDIIFILSAVMAPAVPFTALLCFALPLFLGAKKIFTCGAAIAGWSGLCDVGQSNNLIVTDRDLFPEGSISIESIRIFADEDAQKVISYAGTMIIASGCSMSKAFAEEMEQNKCTVQPMENFEYLSGGGMKGIIDGHVVLCGSSDLMRLMNVRIPFRLVDRTTVLLAIDGILYGIFAMNYEAQPHVRKALVDLMRSNRHPIFALRDFNITPEMLKSTFDIATDGYDFPPYVERFKITETQPSDSSRIAAVVGREGLATVTSMADTGKNMYSATRLNLLITVLSAVLGMLIVSVKMLTTGSIGLGFILMYMIVTAIPVFAVSVFMKF